MANPPDDILTTIILTLLTPLFRPFVDSDELARQAAWAQVQRVGIGPMTDPFTIVQTIGFSMAAATTLAQAANPDLDIDTQARLHRAANSFSRTEERQRRILKDQLRRKPPPPPPTAQEEAAVQAEKAKQVRVARRMGTMIQAEIEALQQLHPNEARPTPATQPQEPGSARNPETRPPTTPKTPVTQRLEKLNWAIGYVGVAEECLNDPDTYAGGSQKEANSRGSLMNAAAYEILTGEIPDVEKPFDLDAMLDQWIERASRPPSGLPRPDTGYRRSAPGQGGPSRGQPRAAA